MTVSVMVTVSLSVTVSMSHVICHMSNAYVDPWDMLNNFSKLKREYL